MARYLSQRADRRRLLVALGFLVAPVAAPRLPFLRRIAKRSSAYTDTTDPPGQRLPLPFAPDLGKFLAVVLIVNALALPLVLVLGFAQSFPRRNAYSARRDFSSCGARRTTRRRCGDCAPAYRNVSSPLDSSSPQFRDPNRQPLRPVFATPSWCNWKGRSEREGGAARPRLVDRDPNSDERDAE